MLKGVSECERVIASLEVRLVLSSVVVLVVAHVLSSSGPALFFVFLGELLRSLRVIEDFHALVVETLRLDHIEQVKLNFRSFLYVGHSEVEPLCMSFGVDIVLNYQIVLMVAHFADELEIA